MYKSNRCTRGAHSEVSLTPTHAGLMVYQFFVRDIDGKSLVCNVFTPQHTIGDLKEWLHDKGHAPSTDEQRLIFCGKPLNDDNMTLGDANVRKDSNIHLVLRLRGGSHRKCEATSYYA